ncbi:RagB/SusD family nutrient uptake outer membrane protein [Catalinimonas niigatensis]|uniref:RagB/SusD family nutrient uptake outer membrane protein n=1 Tax=Catalinimonas niigatensis TaxID=1397264 RepID=UPI002666329D|nr:RagB/SusD family nutrient uptake outer membrane protein [Catalinimonas niigatensis]WPP51978.1 RagB/SusD family nutrient uptake outer membrane protein [Catalinimonas niigatensis]
MKSLLSKIIFLGLFAIVSSCENVLEVEPVGQAVVDNVYTDVNGAINGINAAYNPLTNLYSGGLIPMVRIAHLASDDAYTWRAATQVQSFITTSADPDLERIWEMSYQGINNCNVVLNRVPDVDFNDDPALQNSILGQAYFLRAFNYFNLVRLFGGVPILLEETTTVNEAKRERATVEATYSQIIDDLNNAVQLLPEVSAYNGSTGRERGRASKGSANALLAWVNLTIENWQEAISAADNVISSGQYELFENYADNFYGTNENGTESLFEVQFGNLGSPTSNSLEYFGHPSLISGNGQYAEIATSNNVNTGIVKASGGGIGLVDDFEAGDTRFDVAISYYDFTESVVVPNGPPDPLVNKYFVGTEFLGNASPINFPILRYADLLLIKAEALNEINGGDSEAVNIINNLIRERAGLGPLSSDITSNQTTFRAAIWKERRTETAFEAKRFFDLNRTGRLSERIAQQGVTISAAKITSHPITQKPQFLFAIPFSEIVTNELITQNPGY